MNQILYEVLKPKLGEEETELLIDFEGIAKELMSKDTFEKGFELAKSEFLQIRKEIKQRFLRKLKRISLGRKKSLRSFVLKVGRLLK